LKISLVIPVFNEGKTITALVEAILNQTHQPDEIVFVDGGSTDNTVVYLKQIQANSHQFKLIEAGRAMPGKGRNIGTEAAQFEWIAYTDAGITLDKNWLKELVRVAKETNADLVYGNFSPIINSLFERAATIAYVPPQKMAGIRGRVLPSSLWKKEIWKSQGGFPDWRATEDLILMEKAEKAGYKIAEAPNAMMYWLLRPDYTSTYKKFDLYSKYNVWAGRQAFWHYGVLKQYVVLLPFIFLAFFHHWLWWLMLPVWLVARTVKRILPHRLQFGNSILYNPLLLANVALLILLIDAATFSGWLKAIFNKSSLHQPSAE
jgi:succinoglycan biosynthesis protein ExoA